MGVVLETDRLTLRRFADTAADAALLLDLDADPEVMRYVGPFGLPTADAYQDRIRTVWLPQYARPGQGFFAAHDRPSGLFLGWFVLRAATDYRFAAEAGWTRPTDLELGYRLKKLAWGKGLATEGARALVARADADPAVTGVVSAALEPNRASTRVMEKCGLVRVGAFHIAEFAEPVLTYARWRAGCEADQGFAPLARKEDGGSAKT